MKQLFLLAVFLTASQAEVPIACNLNALTPAQRRELKVFSERVVSAVTGTREMDDGYGFRVDNTKVSTVDLAGGIELWRKCCPFYEFQIDLRGDDGALWLTLRGRKGVKEYFPLDAPNLAAKLPKHGSR
ncbi:MAG TPA: hypothetical protein VGF49_06895 [Candidatus Solibacter sp.]|jgi:hypothetical protein